MASAASSSVPISARTGMRRGARAPNGRDRPRENRRSGRRCGGGWGPALGCWLLGDIAGSLLPRQRKGPPQVNLDLCGNRDGPTSTFGTAGAFVIGLGGLQPRTADQPDKGEQHAV